MLNYRGRAVAALAAMVTAASVGLAVPGEAQTAQPDGVIGLAERVAILTGAGSINQTDARNQVMATDLGIMWPDEQGRTMTAFGDTFGHGWTGPGAATGIPGKLDWRSNTLARSSDQDPSDGLSFDDFVSDRPGHAKELLPSLKQDHVEISTIPTGGINIRGRDYLAYMSVRNFGQPGQWTTNFSGIAYSDDDGQTWTDVPGARRQNTPAFDDPFQMTSYTRQDDYVYAFGTPNGRFGSAHIARVQQDHVLDLGSYEYWNGRSWVRGDPSAAAPILPGPVGEISVLYNNRLNAWMMMYLNEETHAIVLRLASRPTGPWSLEIPVATASQYPQLYGGFLYPGSNGTDVYFNMTQFDKYNVSLMRLALPPGVLPGLAQLPAAARPAG
jgi:hypothetical protein